MAPVKGNPASLTCWNCRRVTIPMWINLTWIFKWPLTRLHMKCYKEIPLLRDWRRGPFNTGSQLKQRKQKAVLRCCFQDGKMPAAGSLPHGLALGTALYHLPFSDLKVSQATVKLPSLQVILSSLWVVKCCPHGKEL